jgi:hypothetical protein
MRKVLLVAFLLLALRAGASHIVGGEFEIIYLSGSMYRVNMIMYFDLKNGEPGARDQTVQARIYRMSDNQFMMLVDLTMASRDTVEYTQPECGSDEYIETEKIVYSRVVTLSASQFGDPQGYYISWERCCRNYLINNIYSQKSGRG